MNFLAFLKSKFIYFIIIGFAATTAVIVVVTLEFVEIDRTPAIDTTTEEGSGSDLDTTTAFNAVTSTTFEPDSGSGTTEIGSGTIEGSGSESYVISSSIPFNEKGDFEEEFTLDGLIKLYPEKS